MNDILLDRVYVDPSELPQATDIIVLSDYNLLWNVTAVSYDRARLYLRSVLGNRFGTEYASRVKAIWRDPNYEPDLSHDYEEEEEDEE